jgi:hypothetical protein
VALVEERVNDLGLGAANSRKDRRDARICHQQAHRAGRAQLVEEPVGQHLQPQRWTDQGFEEHSVEHLAADRDSGCGRNARLAATRVQDCDVVGAAAKVDGDLHPGVGRLADHGGRRFREKRHLGESRLLGGLPETPESFFA